MGFNPDIHRRRSIRIQGYDYAQPGAYFVTLCTQGRECTLGQICAGEVGLSLAGEAVQQQWQDLPNRFNNIAVDTYIIMPNHLHAIITIHPVGAPLAAPLINTAPKIFTPKSSVGALLAAPLINAAPKTFTSKSSVGAPLAAPLINAASDMFKERQGATKQGVKQGAASSAPTVGEILRVFKSLSGIAANRLLGRKGQPFWQRNYWEHIVRSETELHAIGDYIHNNPKQWELDSLFMEASA